MCDCDPSGTQVTPQDLKWPPRTGKPTSGSAEEPLGHVGKTCKELIRHTGQDWSTGDERTKDLAAPPPLAFLPDALWPPLRTQRGRGKRGETKRGTPGRGGGNPTPKTLPLPRHTPLCVCVQVSLLFVTWSAALHQILGTGSYNNPPRLKAVLMDHVQHCLCPPLKHAVHKVVPCNIDK